MELCSQQAGLEDEREDFTEREDEILVRFLLRGNLEGIDREDIFKELGLAVSSLQLCLSPLFFPTFLVLIVRGGETVPESNGRAMEIPLLGGEGKFPAQDEKPSRGQDVGATNRDSN